MHPPVERNPPPRVGYRYEIYNAELLPPMDCRTFRKEHFAFVDDVLPGVKHVAMEQHVRACAECARHDVSVRRSLLLFRNLPAIEPSRDFTSQLHAKLEMERRRGLIPMPAFRGPGTRTFVAAAASVVAVGLLALSSRTGVLPSTIPALPGVVAMQPEDVTALAVATPAFVTSISMGMPVWPALLIAEEAPVRFVTGELRQVSWQR